MRRPDPKQLILAIGILERATVTHILPLSGKLAIST